MAELNTIFYSGNATKQLLVNNSTNEFIVSGYRLVLDQSLNRDLATVSAPTEVVSVGKKGNIAFDKNYVYYCVEDNVWKRAPLAKWMPSSVAGTFPKPSHWWSFQDSGANGQGFSQKGDYNFYTYSALPASVPTFNSSGVYLGSSAGIDRTRYPAGVSLLNFSSNLVEPSSLNQDFTISFETKRLNINATNSITNTSPRQVILGSQFGKLGFYFEYSTSNGYGLGNFVSFKFSTGLALYASIQSTSTGITDSFYHQVVGINDSYNKAISLYVDGILQGSGKYPSPGYTYANPAAQGFAIGGLPLGNVGGRAAATVEANTPLIIRNLGFWKGVALNSGQVKYLYNDRQFRGLENFA